MTGAYRLNEPAPTSMGFAIAEGSLNLVMQRVMAANPVAVIGVMRKNCNPSVGKVSPSDTPEKGVSDLMGVAI